MRLSVVLATFNEEENIRDCLDSVKGWCDEIVVVDGSSTDGTTTIARSYGARVYIYDNPAIFHINKQRAIDKARGNWILQLDADERVTPELKSEIDRVISQGNRDGYWIPRKNYFLGKFLMKGGVYPDYTMRLYKRSKGKLPQKDVHEQAVIQGQVGYLNNPLIHMADPNIFRYFTKFSRYTDLMADQIGAKKSALFIFDAINFLVIKPIYWFILTFVRHKGFMDSWQGLLFSIFSAFRFPVAYIKYIIRSYANRIRKSTTV